MSKGLLWAIASAVAYSVASVLGKHLLDELRPHDMLFWRFAAASVILWAVLAVRRRRGGPPLMPDRPRVLAALGFAFGFTSLVGFFALEHLDASMYIVLVYAYPAMVAAASPLIGHRVRPAVWAALVVTTAGIVVTVPDVFGSADADGIGVVLTLVQAVMYAGYTIASSRWVPRQQDGPVTMAWSMLGATAGLALIVVFAGLRFPTSGIVTVELLAFAIVPTVIAGTCFFQAIRLLAPASVSMVATLEPVLTIGWATLLLGERLTGWQAIGGALVIGGVIAAQRAAAFD